MNISSLGGGVPGSESGNISGAKGGTVSDVGGEKAGLKPGLKVLVQLIASKDGLFTVNINGKEYTAKILPAPQTPKLMAEIIKTQPLLELKAAPAEAREGANTALAREAASFNGKDIGTLLKTLSGGRLGAFLPEEIRKAVKDGGNFLENKLLNGLSAKGDAKLEAYLSGNEPARSAVLKMQAANVLLNGDFFSFFGGEDELDFDNGVMRFRKTPSGDINLYMKVDFTNLGETVLSFSKSPEGGYYITVRTEMDISAELAELKLSSSSIRWAKLGAKDGQFFNIKPEDFGFFEDFDVKV